MTEYDDHDLETIFVRARVDAGMPLEDAKAAWKDVRGKILFVASQPFLHYYWGGGEDKLDRRERTRMRRDARAALGDRVRTDDMTSLAMAAFYLDVPEPSRGPKGTDELLELANEATSFLMAESAGEPAPPTPRVNAFAERFQPELIESPRAAAIAMAFPHHLAWLFARYIVGHALGDLPFDSQSRLFAKAFDKYAQKYLSYGSTGPYRDILDEDDSETGSPEQQTG